MHLHKKALSAKPLILADTSLCHFTDLIVDGLSTFQTVGGTRCSLPLTVLSSKNKGGK